MKIGYSDFKEMLTNNADLPGLMRFRMLYPSTYDKFYKAYCKETGKEFPTGEKSRGSRKRKTR